MTMSGRWQYRVEKDVNSLLAKRSHSDKYGHLTQVLCAYQHWFFTEYPPNMTVCQTNIVN